MKCRSFFRIINLSCDTLSPCLYIHSQLIRDAMVIPADRHAKPRKTKMSVSTLFAFNVVLANWCYTKGIGCLCEPYQWSWL